MATTESLHNHDRHPLGEPGTLSTRAAAGASCPPNERRRGAPPEGTAAETCPEREADLSWRSMRTRSPQSTSTDERPPVPARRPTVRRRSAGPSLLVRLRLEPRGAPPVRHGAGSRRPCAHAPLPTNGRGWSIRPLASNRRGDFHLPKNRPFCQDGLVHYFGHECTPDPPERRPAERVEVEGQPVELRSRTLPSTAHARSPRSG